MKKLLLVLLVTTFGTITMYAQRVAVVEISRILDSMDDYKKAQTQLDEQSALWRQEINGELDKVKGMYNKYQAELPLMNDETKKKREDEISAKEKEVRDLQRERFGENGLLYKKQQDLVKPIQDKVYKAIDNYATERGYDIILDKSSATGILFVNSTIDKTDDVLKKLK
ncbi:MAG TPA: OmpH family outer membrane protein [Saprospiraceae bacterium]|nr:OmpH family outer membrane protein [Saprospiraceae bacterium]HQW55502.1 OmpH family outer membrane protein [Saprospiraceae bacterium]